MTLADTAHGPDWVLWVVENFLPPSFVYVLVVLIVIDVVIIIILSNTICKR